MRTSSVFALVLTVLLAACSRATQATSPTAEATPQGPIVQVEASPRPTATAVPAPTAVPPTPAPRITRAPGEVIRGNSDRPEIALTFDCGAAGVPTPAILDALRNAGLRVTFFLTGQWASTYPQLTRQIAAEHEVANHSWSHPDFVTLNDGQVLAEMARAEEALNRIAGVNTRPFWRAPFGSRNAHLLSLLRDAGWRYEVYWTADSGDWLDISPAQVRANVNKGAANGAIIVEHCGSTQTAAVLPDVIRDLQARGFRIVTVSELLRD